MALRIGSAVAKAGSIAFGWYDAVDLPVGGTDRFPVVLAQGDPGGPVLWITTGIHGDEHTGVVVLHRLLTAQLVAQLHGTVIAMPSLNPAGLRTRSRKPYYLDGDPNRYFPDPDQNMAHTRRGRPEIEAAYQRLYRTIQRTDPAALIDLHNAFIGSIPFVFRDPVFYHRRFKLGRGRNRSDAADLQARVAALIDAFGFTVINEFAAISYLKKNLHRSVSGSVLNGLSVPAFTVELGSWMHVDPGVVEAAAAGCRNVMRRLEMLSGPPEPVESVPIIQPGYPVRRHMGPPAPAAGIADLTVRPGQPVERGQVVGTMRDIFGQPAGSASGLIRAEYDGFVIGWRHGVARYKGESLMALAIRDDSDLIVPYPES